MSIHIQPDAKPMTETLKMASVHSTCCDCFYQNRLRNGRRVDNRTMNCDELLGDWKLASALTFPRAR